MLRSGAPQCGTIITKGLNVSLCAAGSGGGEREVGRGHAELIGASRIRRKRGADGRLRTMSGVDKRHIKLLSQSATLAAAPPSVLEKSECKQARSDSAEC